MQYFYQRFTLLLKHLCTIYNFADDISISHSHEHIAELKLRLEMSADVAIEWFRNNNMQATPSKFQGIVIARGNYVATPVIVQYKRMSMY